MPCILLTDKMPHCSAARPIYAAAAACRRSYGGVIRAVYTLPSCRPGLESPLARVLWGSSDVREMPLVLRNVGRRRRRPLPGQWSCTTCY